MTNPTNISIDFASIKGNEPLPNQKLVAEIKKATPGVSKAGHPKIDVQWSVTETEDGENIGRLLFDTISFAPGAAWRAKQTLQNLGFPEDFSGEIVVEELIGIEACLVVSTEPANGEYGPKNRVQVRPLAFYSEE